MKAKIKIGIAEDHLIVRQGFLSLFKSIKTIKVLFSVSNGKELLGAVKKQVPDIILLDIEMPVMNGKQALLHLRVDHPAVKVIVLSQYFNSEYVVEFIQMDACSFINKVDGLDQIVEAIHAVYQHGHYYSEPVSNILAEELSRRNETEADDGVIKFTKREVQILELLRQNKSNVEVSAFLGIRMRTVEGHRRNLMKKTASKNLAALITRALQKNLIPVNPVPFQAKTA
jgi:DNA-binding NarL/FixJ family response regulator